MLTHVSPVVRGEPNQTVRFSWAQVASLHSLGNLVAAVCVGSVMVALAAAAEQARSASGAWIHWCAAALCLVYLPRELGLLKVPPLLQSAWQVPRRWAADYSPRSTALLFGLGLGAGCMTRVTVPTYYLLFLWPFLSKPPSVALVSWAVYGIARSGNVWWLATTSRHGAPLASASRITSMILQRTATMHRLNAALLAVVLLWCVAFAGQS